MKSSKPALALGIAVLLATACERKAVVVQERRGDLDEVQAAETGRRADVQTEVARQQSAYAVKIGGEKFEPGPKKAREGFNKGAIAGRDPSRR